MTDGRIVTDSHLRILRVLANQRRRQLADHDATDHKGATGRAGRRWRLTRLVTRTRAQVADAEARRRRPSADRA